MSLALVTFHSIAKFDSINHRLRRMENMKKFWRMSALLPIARSNEFSGTFQSDFDFSFRPFCPFHWKRRRRGKKNIFLFGKDDDVVRMLFVSRFFWHFACLSLAMKEIDSIIILSCLSGYEGDELVGRQHCFTCYLFLLRICDTNEQSCLMDSLKRCILVAISQRESASNPIRFLVWCSSFVMRIIWVTMPT